MNERRFINIKVILWLISFIIFLNYNAKAQIQIGQDIDGESSGDNSGVSVSISADGKIVAIGAYRNDGNGLDAGNVRIFNWNESEWVQMGTDIYGDAGGDWCGNSVSLSDDGLTVGIGYPNNDINGDNAGLVRVFTWDGFVWVQKGFDLVGESAGDCAGWSVCLNSDGNSVVVGALSNDGAGSDAGSVMVYDWDGANWVQKGVDIDGEAAGDYFGYSVSINSNGNTFAVGAKYNDGNGSDAGHVRVFDWNGTSWAQKGVDIDGEAAEDYSGVSVSLASDGNTLAIGAQYNDGSAYNAGHVRIYNWTGTEWVQKGLDIDGESTVDWSGVSVSLTDDGNKIAIGASLNDGSYSDAGHVRIYTWNDVSWIQNGIDIDGEAAADHSGYSVSLSSDGKTVAIGANANDGNGSNSGHVRVYSLCANSGTDIISACNSYTWIDGNTYTENNNSATFTLENSHGCDSVVTLNLTINQSNTGTDIVNACDSYTWIDGVVYTENNNTATYTLLNAAGCDSVVTLDLTINTTPDISVTQNGNIITADVSGLSYQWLDCDDDFAPLTGENGQSFLATVNGNYAVELSQNNCSDTSVCFAVTNVRVKENSFNNEIVVYPNPTDGKLKIVLGEEYAKLTVSVSNMFGQLIQTTDFNNQSIIEIDLNEPDGVYFITLTSNQNKTVLKLIKY